MFNFVLQMLREMREVQQMCHSETGTPAGICMIPDGGLTGSVWGVRSYVQFSMQFSFYQAALITHRKGITVRLSAELQPLLFFSMTVLLLLFLGISCTGPRVGSSSEIPPRWTLNGEWKTTFCCLWIPPNWVCFRLRTVVFWVLFFSLPDFIPIADFFYSWM